VMEGIVYKEDFHNLCPLRICYSRVKIKEDETNEICRKNKCISGKNGRDRLLELYLDPNFVIKLVLIGVRIQLM
jgi:hypothetical protein